MGAGMGGNRGVAKANNTPKPVDRTACMAPATTNHSPWKLPNSVASTAPGPGSTIPAKRLTGYQKPWPLAAAHRRAGTAIAAPPTRPPTTPASTGCRRLAPRTTAGIVMPKTNCETMNHGQFTLSGSTGLATCIAT